MGLIGKINMVKSDKKWIDATLPIQANMISWPSDPSVKISAYKEIRTGGSSNVSLLSLGSHAGTHVDAPCHFLDNGRSVDQMPMDAMVGLARVIEIKHHSVIDVPELISKKIRPGQRIFLRTRNSKTRWWKKDFSKHFVFMTLAAAKYFVSKRVKLVGIDALSVGGYAHPDAKAVHKTLLNQGIWIVEGLDLTRVKPGVYDLLCLPLKIYQSDAAPARVLLRAQKQLTRCH